MAVGKSGDAKRDGPSSDRTCFVIAPIDDPESEVRKRSDQILKYLIEPAATDCGFVALRADKIGESGIITRQVLQHVLEDPMVVADLTGRNPNVFYELAIRHAVRKPFVQIIAKGERLPFDVVVSRTIEVDHHDLDSVEAAKSELITQMRAASKANAKVDSPISFVLDLEVFKGSTNPEERQLGDILAGFADVHRALGALDARVSTLVEILSPASRTTARGALESALLRHPDAFPLSSGTSLSPELIRRLELMAERNREMLRKALQEEVEKTQPPVKDGEK